MMRQKHPLSVIVAVLGAAYMAAVAFGLWRPPADYPFIGSQLYDIYARMLIEGRFDLPLRDLRFEGHYAPDGTGYMYHGLGPLLTRLPILPFVALPTHWLAPLSIWFWAVLGNACFHRALLIALDKYAIDTKGAAGMFRTMLALAVWLGAPGIILVSNGAVYYEPIAMAYALSSGFILILAMICLGGLALDRALPWLAVVAGFMVHARPHAALGLYAGVCLMAVFALRQGGRRTWTRVGLAMLVLGAFGSLLLAVNQVRFHNAVIMHGSFTKSELQYGTVFWGYETDDNVRSRTFEHYGRFNPGRILPNLAFYAVAPPLTPATEPIIDQFKAGYRMLIPLIGNRRIEEPRAGMVLLWPFWTILMIAGLRQKALWRPPALAGWIAVVVSGLLMLSYVTISLRYHVDLWPVIALPAVFGVGPIAARIYSGSGKRAFTRAAILVALLFGLGLSYLLTLRSQTILVDGPGEYTGRWTLEHCLEVTTEHGFPIERGQALCRLELSDWRVR